MSNIIKFSFGRTGIVRKPSEFDRILRFEIMKNESRNWRGHPYAPCYHDMNGRVLFKTRIVSTVQSGQFEYASTGYYFNDFDLDRRMIVVSSADYLADT